MAGGRLSQVMVRGAYRTCARTLDALGLKAAFRSHVLPRLLAATQGGPASPLGTGAGYVEEELVRLARHDGPIVVGPWLSEVGYELIYWIPFLRAAIRRHGLDPKRLSAISRGGVAGWYAGVCDGPYGELFDLLTPEEYSRLNETRWKAAGGGQKQAFVDDCEQKLVERVETRLGLKNAALLHPSLMYTLFWAAWNGRAAPEALLPHLDFAPMIRPPLTDSLRAALPERFTAVRFYFRPSLPDTPEVRRRLTELIAALARRQPVVMLNTGLVLDDHVDFAAEGDVVMLPTLGDAATNLDLQARVIAAADRFVGTYGGLSYLPPLMGGQSLALHSEPQHLLPVHEQLAQVATRVTGGRLVNLGLDDLEMVAGALGVGIAAE